ncbi:iron-sulfur cluster assembly protein [Thermococcus argininiproducens]|uniref:Iron-sulfur cluster assembly protein n=1 Tax=Thermococcus argininiproducens TaxID=2866384 RepID=A0A9E7M8P9_9EURY|nr:iron-sulfur cluster assembly protein [Thermococcus argininiproducens]USG99088.1 iron-sulfur cluster assembly protein [Thermococcus argininiproducens]
MAFLDFLKGKPKGKIKELPPEVREVVEELKKVKDPETELNIVDEGLVYGITVEGKNVMVWLFLARSTPECHFCQAIAMNVQKRIIKDIVSVLRDKGFSSVKVYNEIGLLLEEWREKDEKNTAF